MSFWSSISAVSRRIQRGHPRLDANWIQGPALSQNEALCLFVSQYIESNTKFPRSKGGPLVLQKEGYCWALKNRAARIDLMGAM